MKTGNKKTFLLLGISAIAVLLIAFLIIRNIPGIGNGTSALSQSGQKADNKITDITFAVPEFCMINQNNLKLFNEELQKDGHNYQLRLKCLQYDTYSQDLEKELKKGSADVAFLGLGDDSNKIYSLINSGLVLNLDEALSTEKGKTVYNAFPESLWESVKCNGHIYSLPQTLAQETRIYAAFNKDYIDTQAIENWDGSIDGIYKMIKDIEWDDEEAPRFQYLLGDFEFEQMIGCEIRYGLVYDHETKSIEKPLESGKFIGYINTLEKMKREGLMSESVSYAMDTSSDHQPVNIESGRFLVVLDQGIPNEVFNKDNICIKELAPVLTSRVNGSIGISNKTKKLDAVIDFLGLLYGESKYANILLYGRQDEDYKLVDGLAVNMDGTDIKSYILTNLALNLFINVHPVKGEIFPENRKEEYFAFYNNIKLSPFIGFEADASGNENISIDLQNFLSSLNSCSLDEAVSNYSGRFKTDGIDEYYSSVKKQWETFHK